MITYSATWKKDTDDRLLTSPLPAPAPLFLVSIFQFLKTFLKMESVILHFKASKKSECLQKNFSFPQKKVSQK